MEYQQSTSRDLHQKLSELQVAFRASERVREEAQRETDSLRVYVGSVEAAAAGLLSRVQELEHLLALSSVVKSGRNIDVVRGRVATAATREVQKQAAQAAQAIAAAREATMELDKVRRETNALIKAQCEEIKRLNIEAAETCILYEASRTKLQDVTHQSQRLKQNLEQQSSNFEEVHKAHKVELASLQKKYETMKVAAKERGSKNTELKKANEISKVAMRNSEKRLEEAVLEKKDLVLQVEILEQQVKSLQIQDMSAAIAHYDHELQKVRASLGAEKAQLLIELAQLRRSNHKLRGEVEDWQDKFAQLSSLNDIFLHSNQSLTTKNSDSADHTPPGNCKLESPVWRSTAKNHECCRTPPSQGQETDKGCVSGSTGTSFKHTEIRESRDSMLVSEELWSKLASVDLISNTKEVNKQLGTHSVNQHTPEQNCMLDLTELSSKNSQVSP
ncbi:hypothetical protein BDL97_13G042300 [Sphagnum fallax]|nr:hypothetical protein BDL97_13G042300 [Sphagnum fallax]